PVTFSCSNDTLDGRYSATGWVSVAAAPRPSGEIGDPGEGVYRRPAGRCSGRGGSGRGSRSGRNGGYGSGRRSVVVAGRYHDQDGYLPAGGGPHRSQRRAQLQRIPGRRADADGAGGVERGDPL